MWRKQGTQTQTAGRKRAGVILLVFSLLFAITAITLPRKRLLSRARRIAPASFLWAGKVRVSYPCYWLSENEAIAFQQPAMRQFVDTNWAAGDSAFRVDAATGTYKAMPAFTKLFTAIFTARERGLKAQIGVSSGASLHLDIPCRVSPDGKFALITETIWPACFGQPDYASSRNAIFALDGSYAHTGKWKRNEVTAFWEADSRHWKEWRYEHGALKSAVCGLDGSSRTQRVFLPPTLANYDMRPCAVTPAGTFLAEIEKREPDDAPVATSDVETLTEECRFEWIELSTERGRLLRHFAPYLPQVTNVIRREVVFSPDCDRIGWLVTTRYEPTGPQFWKQLRARFGDIAHEETAVWVSKLDGTEAREIGHIAHKPDAARPQQLAWLPDGTQLSFNYKGDLYTVSAD